MENIVKRVIKGVLIALLASLLVALPVLALATKVTNLLAFPQAVSIHLTWTRAVGSTTTVIRYRTDMSPTSYSDGILSYNGTGYECDVTGLTAGQSYYFGAWGFDGASYSTDGEFKSTTTLYTLGLSTNQTMPSPTIPATINDPPDISGLSFEPFTSVVGSFVSSLGMDTNNAWEWIFVIMLVIGGVILLGRTKELLIAITVLILLTAGGWGLRLIQGYALIFEIVVLLGVYAIQHQNA
jgi:hypothetical protein